MNKLAESDYVEFHEMIAERKQLLAALERDRYWMQEHEKEAERVCVAAGVSDLDALLARIAELEAENKRLKWVLNFIRAGRSARSVRDAEAAYDGCEG